ncbi:uncharacterized protein LOC123718446 isoform X1 [Pieris brassicae]|uniref:Uncharacterized protein n=1 Tax=Pieris brassicae TaxID=7116 RepID=A0A9P0XLU1_PIEBR|nr:uncharacterized protein LOC123718446 isoform X1 [Pieris brassicae]XP_045530894.1 uncharacterized protein LOC123718446 isoform X1 [Pieris brassicae]CAH4039063.1 unnamed protein product [Pieris brassicae]
MADLQKFISDKLQETIHNADVMGMLQKLLESFQGEESEGLKAQLKEIMEQYEEMGDSEKEMFLTYIKELLARKLATHFQNNPPDLSKVEDVLAGAVRDQMIFVAVVVLIVIGVVVFFGYKLYKSIKEKEMKKEEKKKQKQSKKKK